MASPAWPAPMMTVVVVRMAALRSGPSCPAALSATSTVTLVGLVTMS